MISTEETSSRKKLQLQEVFVTQGFPEYTFVQPEEYSSLLLALRTAGRSIVVEGPSGIGKTTAVDKAIADAGMNQTILKLSGRKREDIDLIKVLAQQIPFWTVVIDDFHRLEDDTKRNIADLMKTLADEGAAHSKVIVIGIPNAGRALIAFGKDLANRIEVVPFDSNPEYKVDELIAKGEAALNVRINIRDEIIQDSQGSFYIAQMLASKTLARSEIFETCDKEQATEESFELIRAQVMVTLARSFHDTAIAFARGSKLRPEGRAPYLHLLYWLSQAENWSINAEREADRHPAQRGSVSQVVTKGFLNDLISSSEGIQSVLHFDPLSKILVVQDPQFIFYIRNLSWTRFAEEVGYISLEFPARYDFALSFAGPDRDIAESIFSELEDNQFEVFYDRNEQHRILAKDVEEYLAPIYLSDADIVVCILGPEYPKRIWTKFESDQFKVRFQAGGVVPIVLKEAPLGVFDTATKIGHLSWDRGADIKKQLTEVIDNLKKMCAANRAIQHQNTEKKRTAIPAP